MSLGRHGFDIQCHFYGWPYVAAPTGKNVRLQGRANFRVKADKELYFNKDGLSYQEAPGEDVFLLLRRKGATVFQGELGMPGCLVDAFKTLPDSNSQMPPLPHEPEDMCNVRCPIVEIPLDSTK